MYRNTYAKINLKNIYENTKNIIEHFSNYEYPIAVVKADCYGHNSHYVIEKIIHAGAKYLAVATLDEALQIRENFKEIPILCLGIIPIKYLSIAEQNNITITISSLEYVKQISQKGLLCHIKVNTGMNRLGLKNADEIKQTYELLEKQGNIIEGIYTHIHTPNNEKTTNEQFEKFEELTSKINIYKIPIRHICASRAFEKYPKKDYANGIRLGINMYGFSDITNKNTFELISEVIQINSLEKGEYLGYNLGYIADKKTKIAVIPIGYADGIIRQNKGRYVYINDRKYPIVGNVCMDMLFIEVDDNVKLYDTVYLIKDNEHLSYIAKYLNTVEYEVICSIGKRVPRIYIEE